MDIINPIGAVYKQFSKAQMKVKDYDRRMESMSTRSDQFNREYNGAKNTAIGLLIVLLFFVFASVGIWVWLLILVIRRWNVFPDWLKVVGIIGLLSPGWQLIALILVLFISKKP